MIPKEVWRVSILRSLYYSARYGGQIVVFRGTRIRMDRGARISVPRGCRVTLGTNYTAGKPCSLDLRRNARLTIHGRGRVSIARGARILILEGAHVEIGHESVINYDAVITCFEHIKLEPRVGISWNANVFDGNLHELVVDGVPRPRTKPVHIGNHAWIGSGATVLGAKVGAEAIVGAASVVVSDIPARALAVGNPARVISKDVYWRV